MSLYRTEIAELKKIVGFINSRFERECLIDFFKIASYDGKKLTIYGSRDFTCYHNIELFFEKVTYLKGDFEWSRNDEKPLIQIAEISEVPGNFKVKFVMESDGYYHSNFEHRVEIWAEAISFNFDTVLYWRKEVLAPGERIASWVK